MPNAKAIIDLQKKLSDAFFAIEVERELKFEHSKDEIIFQQDRHRRLYRSLQLLRGF